MSLTKVSYSMISGAPVNVQDKGAIGNGVSDDTQAILDAGATGQKVVYPQGTYTFNSATNPDFTAGIELVNATVNGPLITDIYAVDSNTDKFIGLHQNYLQSTAKPTSIGTIVEAPMSTASASGPVDLIGHFYNDFGLQGSPGWSGWYTWQWNFVGNTGNPTAPYTPSSAAGYTPNRHPLLGWYRGDEVNVLDWQCYWLREYGVNTICPVGTIDTATWSNPSSGGYWVYQLFNNVKNFKGMRYIPWVQYEGNALNIAANWTGTIYDICGTYRNNYTIEQDGKCYLVLFLWDDEALRGALDGFGGSIANGIAFYEARGNEARIAGYDGICVLARNAGAYNAYFNEDAQGAAVGRDIGLIYMNAGYGGFTGNPQNNPANTTYADLVNNISFSSYSGKVATWVSTAMESVYPHPSEWTWSGSTPALFQRGLQNAIKGLIANNQPRLVTIYNVAEWAEGGPGLQPNRQDGFGYLEACRNVLSSSTPEVVDSFPYSRWDVRTQNIYPGSNGTVQIWSDYNQTLTGATWHPTIQAGYEGQVVRLMCTPTIGNYSITLNSQSFEAGTNLFLTANQITLGPWDSVELQYFGDKGWVQIGNVVNIP